MADLHLSPFIWNSHRAIIGDAYYALGMITGELLKLRTSMPADEELVLLIAGDIFDSTTPDPYTEKILQQNLGVLKEHGVVVLSVQGNHEFHAKTARASLFGTQTLGEIPYVVNGVTFCGIDYTASTEELHEKVAAIPPCNYLVMHAPFRHLLGFADKYQIEKDDIPGHIENVIVGDIHKQSLIQNAEGTRILSPGSTHPRSITEIEGGHGVHIHKQGSGMDAGSWMNVLPRKFIELTVMEESDADVLRGQDLRTYDEPLQPVIIMKVTGEAYGKAMAVAEETGALVVSKSALKVEAMDTQIEVQEEIPTLLEALPLVIQATAEALAYSLLEQLLSANDPKGTLDAFRDKMISEEVA